MFTKIIYLLYIISAVIIVAVEITVDEIPSTCSNDTDCDSAESANDSDATTPQSVISESKNSTVNNTKTVALPKPTSQIPVTSTQKPNTAGPRSDEEICHCDLTVMILILFL